jgi:hypothetical protein
MRSARSSQGYQPKHSYGPPADDSLHDRDDWATSEIRDDEAFLDGIDGFPRLSPAVAARERYMARKEAEGSPNYYRDGSADPSKRGCFAGRKKWAWIGGAIVLLAIIAGVVAGVTVYKDSAASSKGVAGVVQSDASDPSIFTKNAALHQSFYGMCYTPLNAQVGQTWPVALGRPCAEQTFLLCSTLLAATLLIRW